VYDKGSQHNEWSSTAPWIERELHDVYNSVEAFYIQNLVEKPTLEE